MSIELKVCSNCFKDQGLKLDAEQIGIEDNSICFNCNSKTGKKLDNEILERIAYRFFVKGSLVKMNYGAAPIIQFNKHQKTSIIFNDNLNEDAKLFEKFLGIGFFRYGPRLWMLGEIEALISLQAKNEREIVIEKILQNFPVRIITPNDIFFRIRINPSEPNNIYEYDSSPKPGKGRLDSKLLPVLYGSQNIEMCIHECRATVEDDIYMATLRPLKKLKLLDLSEVIEEDEGEHESLDLAVNMLFFAQKHSYKLCRLIASRANDKGFDGLIYPSYYSSLGTGSMPFETAYGISIRKFEHMKDLAKSRIIQNLAIFGKPIFEDLVHVECINKLCLENVKYNFHFGPVEYD